MTPHPPVYFMDSIRYESYHFIEVQGLVQDQAEMPTDQAIRIPTVKFKIPRRAFWDFKNAFLGIFNFTVGILIA